MASKRGKPSVIVEEFENGRRESEILTHDGVDIVKHGKSQTWFNGNLVLSEYYVNDKLDGEQFKYYVNGDVYKITTWAAGVRHGRVVINHPNGDRTEYSNVDGEISGAKCTFNTAGDLIEEIWFDD